MWELLGYAAAAFIGWTAAKLHSQNSDPKFSRHDSYEDIYLDDENPLTQGVPMNPVDLNKEYKLVLCVRTDLKMGKGKIAAQCGHATLGAYQEVSRTDRQALACWEYNGQPKIAVQIKSLEEARKLQQRARQLHVPSHAVIDAGRTQIAPGSMTVLALGPAEASLIDQVSGSLKLL